MPVSLKRFLRLPPSLSYLERAWLFAPFAIWLSYHPLVRLGSNATMYFELSVTLLFIAILSLLSLPVLWRSRRQVIRDKSLLPVTAFVLISGLSLVWTVDPVRGIMTFGVLGALYCIYLACVCEAKKLTRLLPTLTKLLVLNALLVGVLALVQMFAGIWLDQSTALLCRGCTAQQFGFVRPNVFAIEPQFLGNLLLAPALILLHLFITPTPRYKYTGWALFFVATTLLLTLSRGAIFAFAVGTLILFAAELRNSRAFGKITALFGAAFVTCLLIQASLAAIHPKLDTSFVQAIRVSVNQLSLGVINLPAPKEHTVLQQAAPIPKVHTQTTPAAPKADEKAPNFDGYVEESTNTRLELSSLGVQLWRENISRVVFGVGLGGSGQALRQEFPTKVGQREIVQNEYVEILVENGLLGILAFAVVLGSLMFTLRRDKWLWAIVGAFLVQWNFFSGYPNALHIYLIFILCVVYATRPLLSPSSKQSSRAQKGL